MARRGRVNNGSLGGLGVAGEVPARDRETVAAVDKAAKRHHARIVPAKRSCLSRPVARVYSLLGSWAVDYAAASVEPSGSGDADVVRIASTVERVGALADRRSAGRTATTNVPVRRHRARLAGPGQRRNAARNGCQLGRDFADRVPRPPIVEAVSATIGDRPGPRRRGQAERDVSLGRGPRVGSAR